MSKYERIKSSENKNYRYRTTVFIICLLVSALLWLTIKFSSDYTVEIPYSISLKGIPEGKVLVNQPDSVLRINVKASGYALLKCRYLSRHDSYEVNVSQWIGRISAGTSDATINTLLIAQHIKEERSLPGIIEFVSPEELSLKFDRGVSKQVPIIPDVSYSFAQQYFAYDSLIIEPQLATIYGTTDDIDRVHFLKTNALKFDDLSESIDTMVNILNPRSNAIVIEPEQAWISLLVEKFTEAEVEVAVKRGKGFEQTRVKFFPERVKVVYLIALKDFKNNDPEMFTCTVNMPDDGAPNGKRLNVEGSDHSSSIKIQYVMPSDVEYIILK